MIISYVNQDILLSYLSNKISQGLLYNYKRFETILSDYQRYMQKIGLYERAEKLTKAYLLTERKN